MRIMNRISLRMRITLLSGGILLLCSVGLALGAAYNARLQFNEITLENGSFTIEQVQTLPGKLVYPDDTTTDFPMLTKARRQFDTTNILTLAFVSVLGMCLIYVVAGRSLRPIHELSRTISEITEDNLRQRIPDDNRNDEVGALGCSFNIMLDRLEKSFLRQKRFSASAAHELKTPLATINAGIQVLHLEQNPSISDCEETLATTERNIKRLMAVVDDLMSLYEQEELETAPIDLKNMFESVFSELRPALNDKHIETELRCGLKTVRGNQVLLYRACFNLIENAAKYNKDGGKITVEIKPEGGGGRIMISDTGSGIPEDELRQIFEPFYRVNKSRSRKAGGAGLGLAIVKSIVEKHGWKITVDSKLEQGSTFTVTFE